MVQYKLTMSQREVLEALIRLYEQKKRLIKSKEIADMIHRDEGTVRNIILSLKSLGLIESKTGPRGGYMPTLKAYEVIRGSVTQIPVKLRKDGKELDLTITGIEILDILNPEGGRAILRVHGVIRKLLKPGDRVEIGPTPLVGVRIEGTVIHIDPVSNQISVKINRMVSVPRVHVGEIAARSPFTVPPDMDIRSLAKELTKRRIRGAPVVENDRIVGVITLSDIAKALAEGKVEGTVAEYMSTPPIVIRETDDLVAAIELMNRHGIGRLPVIDSSGKLVGIVTRTDILRFIAGLS